MIINPYVYSLAFDTDAQAFITATNITDNTQKSAINTLVTDLKTYGLWSKMRAIYPFVGGTATTHKWNLKDPRDDNSAFRILWNGGVTHSSNGVLFGGSTGYGDTNFINSQVYGGAITNHHISFYSRNNTSKPDMLGIQDDSVGNASQVYIQDNGINQTYSILNIDSNTIKTTLSQETKGFYLVSRISSNSANGYKNGNSQGSNVNISTGLKSNIPYLIGVFNYRYISQIIDYGNKECAFASIGDGLTSFEVANFYTAVQSYQTTLGRQV